MHVIVIIMIVYMAAMIGIGVYSRTKIKNATDYHLAGRRLGVIMMAGTLAATEIPGTRSSAGSHPGSWASPRSAGARSSASSSCTS